MAVAPSDIQCPPLLLVGNPNVGKSVIFGALTRRYVTVCNYPGTTVEITRGSRGPAPSQPEIVDTPGTNSLPPQSEDERVTRDILLAEPEALVVQVGDIKNLRRALYLTRAARPSSAAASCSCSTSRTRPADLGLEVERRPARAAPRRAGAGDHRHPGSRARADPGAALGGAPWRPDGVLPRGGRARGARGRGARCRTSSDPAAAASPLMLLAGDRHLRSGLGEPARPCREDADRRDACRDPRAHARRPVAAAIAEARHGPSRPCCAASTASTARSRRLAARSPRIALDAPGLGHSGARAGALRRLRAGRRVRRRHAGRPHGGWALRGLDHARRHVRSSSGCCRGRQPETSWSASTGW